MDSNSIPKSQIAAKLKGMLAKIICTLDAQYIFNTVPISHSSTIFLEKAEAKAYVIGFKTACAAGFGGTQDEFNSFVDTDTSANIWFFNSLDKYEPPSVAHESLQDIYAYIEWFNYLEK